MKKKDERVKTMNEILNGIKVRLFTLGISVYAILIMSFTYFKYYRAIEKSHVLRIPAPCWVVNVNI